MKKGNSTEKQKLCLACRKCCETVGTYTDPDIYEASERELIRFYRARGLTVTKEDGYLFLHLEMPCPHLKENGCDIYAKRPKLCREYTGLDDFGKGCLWSSLPEYRKKTAWKKNARAGKIR